MKVMKGVSCKELKREVGSETARVHGVHRGFVVGNNTGKWTDVTLEQSPLHLQRRLLLEIVSRRVCTDSTMAVFIPSAVYVSWYRVKCLAVCEGVRHRMYVCVSELASVGECGEVCVGFCHDRYTNDVECRWIHNYART